MVWIHPIGTMTSSVNQGVSGGHGGGHHKGIHDAWKAAADNTQTNPGGCHAGGQAGTPPLWPMTMYNPLTNVPSPGGGPLITPPGQRSPPINVNPPCQHGTDTSVTPPAPPGQTTSGTPPGTFLPPIIDRPSELKPIWINYAKPPADAGDPTGAKAPGMPGPEEGFENPKGGGPEWVPNPNPGKGASSHGWEDAKGRVWCPTGQGTRAHGGPHWDVQLKNGKHVNVYPGQNINNLT